MAEEEHATAETSFGFGLYDEQTANTITLEFRPIEHTANAPNVEVVSIQRISWRQRRIERRAWRRAMRWLSRLTWEQRRALQEDDGG